VLIAFLCFPLTLEAQFPGAGRGNGASNITGKITGTVLDSLTGEPIEFATVVLQKAKGNNEQVNGTITETDGSFRLTDVKIADYQVTINFLGYQPRVITGVGTTPKKPDYDLGTILLSPDSEVLETVEVVGEAALIENRIDKLVYNAEKDASTSGGDGADVLRNVPLLSVDLEGNVSLRGSSNIQILINDRPSTLFASSPADALKTIPADQIKQVEVITTPSAKYDGEGSGGIINIITKKKTAEGFTGTVGTSIGTRQNNANLNVNAVSGRFGVNGGANAFWSWNRPGEFSFFRESGFTTGNRRILEQNGINNSQVLGYNGSLGAFYDFNAFNSINTSIRFNGFNNYRDGEINGELYDPTEPGDGLNFSRFNDTDGRRTGFDWTTDYKKTWAGNSEREWTFAFQLSGNRNRQEDVVLQDGNAAIYTSDLNNFNDGLNLEYTFQSDYVHPFTPEVKLETGLKAVIREIDSDYRTLQRPDDSSPYSELARLTDQFFYDQDVYAAYASFNFKLGQKLGVVAGARYEHTDIAGDYESDTEAFVQNYDNLLPSIILQYKLKNFSNLKASYTRRIQRPSLFFINPFTQITDPNSLTVGNPSLDPEKVDQWDLAYSTFIKGWVLNASVFLRRTTDLIESFQNIDAGGQISETTFFNIGENTSPGFNIFSSVTIKEIWTIRGNFNYTLYNARSTRNGIDLERTSSIWNGFLNSSLKLGNDWQVEAFGFFNSPSQTLQGFNPSFSLFSMGIRKEFTERTSLGIRAVEPFVENKPFASELQGADFVQRSEFTIPFRSIGISFSHKFGSLNFRERQRRSSINNDDQKGGDNQQF
jgi:outer membrane receptor protein involved in Fe transport